MGLSIWHVGMLFRLFNPCLHVAGAFCYWICIKQKEQARDLHLGKGAGIPWAILSVVCVQSELHLLNY